MRRWLKWILVILVVSALVAGVARALSARKAQQEAAAQQAGQRVDAAVELAPQDLVQVRQRELSQSLVISGTLKAAKRRRLAVLTSSDTRVASTVKTASMGLFFDLSGF